MGPEYGLFGLCRGTLGTLKGTYRVYSRYRRISGVKGPHQGTMVSTLETSCVGLRV